MKKIRNPQSAIRTALACFLCLANVLAGAEESAKPAPAPQAQGAAEAPGEWQKLETHLVPLPQPRQVLSPGLFDKDLQRYIVFPKDGGPVDTGLPHGGRDKDGKEYPAILARLQQNVVWIDFNGDGKISPGETRTLSRDGTLAPFFCELHYDDGTAGQYSFGLKTVVENEKYALVRCAARTVEFQGHKLVFLDDNGNGKYDDVGQDVVIVGDGPPCFLGKYLKLGDKFYEILVHPAGATVEIRTAGKLDKGTVDLFAKYKPPQKAENLRIHMVIIAGPEGSFSFDEQHKTSVVPAGTYDLVFGLFERAKEVVYMRKGQKTSFSVAVGQTATPLWGAPVKAQFTVAIEEKGIVASPPTFVGAATEEYVPDNLHLTPVRASMAQVFTDPMKVEHKIPTGGRAFEVQPNGELGPVAFKPTRLAPDEYELDVEYSSGILGAITGRERIQYVPAKKKPVDKKN
ncbi:MAG: hypothetical protein ABSE73_15335 [Planctomycetota bacterium]